MLIAQLKQRLLGKTASKQQGDFASETAYDIWAGSYDAQPDNLMLALDEEVFSVLLKQINMEGSSVADIGCGTGRHWPEILKHKPRNLTGFDVSAKMLAELKTKFPEADVVKIDGYRPLQLGEKVYDVLLSTLTVAHIADMERSVKIWTNSLKEKSSILITDFHPEALARGGKRTFEHDGHSISIINYVHTISKLLKLFGEQGFALEALEERFVDEQVKHYYEKKNALAVYHKFKNQPMIYGMLLTRK
jgi:ubiquinone/menaquinone biosynthesis C-methylase UbiE